MNDMENTLRPFDGQDLSGLSVEGLKLIAKARSSGMELRILPEGSKDCKEVFTDIYARKVWGHGSGGGSDPERARPYCDFVMAYMKECSDLDRVLDIGCGDGRVARAIKWGSAEYVGVDAAQGFDALTDPLPAADLVLCKEVLQHLSNEQVGLLLKRTDHYPRRLFTSITGEGTNVDIETGQSRPVDIMLPPFNRPARNVFAYGNGYYVIQEL